MSAACSCSSPRRGPSPSMARLWPRRRLPRSTRLLQPRTFRSPSRPIPYPNHPWRYVAWQRYMAGCLSGVACASTLCCPEPYHARTLIHSLTQLDSASSCTVSADTRVVCLPGHLYGTCICSDKVWCHNVRLNDGKYRQQHQCRIVEISLAAGMVLT